MLPISFSVVRARVRRPAGVCLDRKASTADGFTSGRIEPNQDHFFQNLTGRRARRQVRVEYGPPDSDLIMDQSRREDVILRLMGRIAAEFRGRVRDWPVRISRSPFSLACSAMQLAPRSVHVGAPCPISVLRVRLLFQAAR